MAKKRKGLKITLALAGICLLVLLCIPWRFIVEKRLIAMLEAQGHKQVSLQVTGIGFSSFELQNLSIGEATPFTLKHITLDYSLTDLWQGRIKNIALSDLMLEAHKQSNAWSLSGLEHLPASAPGAATIPATADIIPFATAAIENSHIHIASDALQGDIPLNLRWTKSPTPQVDYTGTALTVKAAGISAFIGDSTAHITLKDKTWAGTWSSKNIALTGLPVDVPVTQSSGTVTAEGNRLTLQGKWGSSDGAFKASFSMNYLFNKPDSSTFTVTAFTMPWNGGMITLNNVVVPLSGKQAYTVPIIITNVSVDALLQPLTGKRATATGTVSGMIPLVITPDGGFALKEGALNAAQPGTIVMAPDAIPGDNAQIQLVRDVMKDFHYKVLSLAVDNDKNNKLSVTLALEGNNPTVYNGRPVKLNVHLGGDVLDFISQSMSVNDPQKLLKQSIHAK